MALTVQQIHAAASAIDASGQKPTLAGIRAKLGSGSYSTISAALQTWERKPTEEMEVDDAPQEVIDAVEIFGKTIWAAAVKHASKAFDDQRAEHALALERSRASFQDIATLSDNLEEKLQAHIDELAHIKRKHEHQSVELENRQRELARVQAIADEREKTILALPAFFSKSKPAFIAPVEKSPILPAVKPASKTSKVSK